MKGGYQPEQQYGETRDCKREEQDCAVDFDFCRKPCRLRIEVQTSAEKFQHSNCEEYTKGAPNQCEQKTFPQQLLHQTPTAGSQSCANGKFVLASRRARQE